MAAKHHLPLNPEAKKKINTVVYIDSCWIANKAEQIALAEGHNNVTENHVGKVVDERKILWTQRPSVDIFDQKTHEASLLLFDLENSLRRFVKSKQAQIKASYLESWKSTGKKEFQPWRKPISFDLIYYSSFDELRKIITQNENWSKTFQSYFGNPNGMISRLIELDSVRDTVAHNRKISDYDFGALKALYRQILACLKAKNE